MHIFSDFAFDIFELLVQSFLLNGRKSLLRQRKQQEVLFPDMRGVQFGELLEQIDNTLPYR